MEAGLHALLQADASLSSLVGNRIHPLVLPEDCVKPAVVYQRISTVPTITMDGPADLTTCRLQFDCYGTHYNDVKACADAVSHVLEGYTGTLPDGTYVFDIELDGMQDRYESEARLYRVSADYFVRFAR